MQTTTMDVGVTTRYSNEPATNSKPSQNNRHAHKAHPSTPNKQVNFQTNSDEKKREKFLTAKYGAHQMALIRKRLRVEMWMYERLQELYGAEDIEIDLDEVLDMDSEMERQQYIRNLLREPQGASENINIFVGDLLEKVKTL
eukprot:TCALIF_08770-PA protein Name:"Similar to Ppp1r14c Protein phosphatase 1 regulatory subunit 14C (Mus musculus)" AED:0.04 eAED:0.04 QI:0/0.75/0.6/0.8/0.75/0.6/5/982/141